MRPSKKIITPEGYPFIAYTFGLFLLLAPGACLFRSYSLAIPAVLALCLCIFTISFFRNPERTAPADQSLIIAPADGTVVYAGSGEHELMGACCKISIFMSVFNVHVNRIPFDGRLVDKFYKNGRFLDARDRRASSENEQLGIMLETADGVKMLVVQIAGLIARRIICYAEKGEQLKRGDRYGLIRFGSRVDLYLPSEIAPLINVGQKTVAGETVLASFKKAS